MTVYIYGLFDPRNLELRYIGRAKNPQNRFYRHIHEARKSTATHKSAWIRGLLNDNLKPAIEILEECTEDNWQEIEQAWIAEAKEKGANILNETLGGEGLIGYVYSEEQKQHFSKIRKGRKLSEKAKELLRIANTGKIFSDERKKNISLSKKGKPSPLKGLRERWSEEQKQKQRDKMLGRKASEEMREKMRKSNAGEGNPMFGKAHTIEAREKMSEGMKGRIPHNKGKHHSEETRRKISEANKRYRERMKGLK